MNPQEQRIAIAEAIGYVKHMDETDDSVFFIHKADGDEFPYRLAGDLQIPNYLSDLNAMHEVEKTLDEKQQRAYAVALHPVMTYMHPMSQDFQVAHATAAQRAEAFLKTVGKWKS